MGVHAAVCVRRSEDTESILSCHHLCLEAQSQVVVCGCRSLYQSSHLTNSQSELLLCFPRVSFPQSPSVSPLLYLPPGPLPCCLLPQSRSWMLCSQWHFLQVFLPRCWLLFICSWFLYWWPNHVWPPCPILKYVEPIPISPVSPTVICSACLRHCLPSSCWALVMMGVGRRGQQKERSGGKPAVARYF